MKILNKIYIHPITYITFIITFLTGQFKSYILFLFIIICHELGHILVSLYFKWNIISIIILPFGGLTKYQTSLNKPIYEEFLVSISGIIAQLIFMFLFKSYFKPNYIYYNICIIIFNLIPILPLDGSKIFNCFLNKLLPFKKSHKITIYISFVLIIILALRSSFILLISLSFLFYNCLNESLNHKYIYNKFLLERYINNFDFKKIRVVNNVNSLYKDCKHVIKDKNYITEKEKLKKYFNKGV